MFHCEYINVNTCFTFSLAECLGFNLNMRMKLRLVEIRESRGVKQADLAQRLSISRSQVANIESGTRKMSVDMLQRWADALECRVSDLLDEKDSNRPTDAEEQLLSELRASVSYNPRLILAAVQGVMAACHAAETAASVPSELAGSPALVAKLIDRWNALGERQREATIHLMDAAQSFSQ